MFKENNNKCEWEDYDSEEEEKKNKYKKGKKGKEEDDKNNMKIDKLIPQDENKNKNIVRNFYEKNDIDFKVEL